MSALQLALEAALQDLDISRNASVADQKANRSEHIPPPAPEHLRALGTWVELTADMPPSTSPTFSPLYTEVLKRLLEYKVPSLAFVAADARSTSTPAPSLMHLITLALIAAGLMYQMASCWRGDRREAHPKDRLNAPEVYAPLRLSMHQNGCCAQCMKTTRAQDGD